MRHDGNKSRIDAYKNIIMMMCTKICIRMKTYTEVDLKSSLTVIFFWSTESVKCPPVKLWHVC